MPTPIPIIETRIGVIVLMSVSPARMKSRMNAVPDGDDGERDRNRGRDERSEDDQQDDERGHEPEQLLYPLLDRRSLGVAVELDGHSCRLDRLAHSVLHGDDLRSRSAVSIASENWASAYAIRPSFRERLLG